MGQANALAVNAAIRWLGDFVCGRGGAWADTGTRLRVQVIASLLVLQGVCAFVVELRDPQQPVAFYIAIDVACIAAGAGIWWRSKAAYLVAFINTLFAALLGSAAAVFLPIIALVGWDIRAGSPVDTALIADAFLLVGIAIFAVGAWKFYPLAKWLRRRSDRLESPLFGLVIVGASLVIAWSSINAIDPTLILGWLSNKAFDPDLRMALLFLILVPMFAYILWSYVTLRSRAVRDAFELP